MSDTAAAWATAIENLQREDLDPEDEARQYQALLPLVGGSQRDLAEQLGIGREYVRRRLLLLRYPDLLADLRAGTVTQRAALEQAARRAALSPQRMN